METAIGMTLAAVLVFVAVFFGVRQGHTLALARADSDMPEEERAYLRRQARRRLVCSALLLMLAGFIAVWFFIEPDPAQRQVRAPGEPLSQEAKDEVRFFVFYWISPLLLLLVVLLLAAGDLWATARYGLRQHRELEQSRRAMLEMEAAKLRRRRQELN